MGLNDKAVAKVWGFKSSSSSKIHEARLYEDGTTSCNCRGWSQHVHADGSRACRHTRSVEGKTADFESEYCNDYTQSGQTKEVKKAPAKKALKKAKPQPEKMMPSRGIGIARKILIDE